MFTGIFHVQTMTGTCRQFVVGGTVSQLELLRLRILDVSLFCYLWAVLCAVRS
jgi:hypothetical protein